MANIRVDVDYQIVDGQPLTFKAPCPCSEISGLTVYYAIGQGQVLSKEFVFKDAHGNDLSDVNNLFDANAYVKVILNTRDKFAYIQNADTNAYLEGKFENIDGRLNGMLTKPPVGSIHVTSTNTNPSSYLGGKWELIDKKFKRATFKSENVDGLVTPGSHMSEAAITFLLNDNEIFVTGTFKTADSWSELDYIIFKTDLAKLGCSRLAFQSYVFAAANNAEGIAWGSFDTNGTFTGYKVFPEKDGTPMPAGRTLAFSTSLPVQPSYMNDAFCDKFYWKRTA